MKMGNVLNVQKILIGISVPKYVQNVALEESIITRKNYASALEIPSLPEKTVLSAIFRSISISKSKNVFHVKIIKFMI